MFAFSEFVTKPAAAVGPYSHAYQPADKESFPSKSTIKLVNDQEYYAYHTNQTTSAHQFHPPSMAVVLFRQIVV